MSRFWAGQSEDSGSDSDSSSGSSSENETRGPRIVNERRWDVDSDSDSEEENRRVVSAKDKTWLAMEADVTSIKNFMKNNDWNQIYTTFEELKKKVAKQQTLIAREGGVPVFFIRLLVNLEDELARALKDKDLQRRMSKANARALNKMKLMLRKHNAGYSDKIDEFRKNPVESEAEAESDSSDSDDSDSDDSDSSDSDSDDSDSDDSDSDDSDSDDSDSDDSGAARRKKKKAVDPLDSDFEDDSSSSESEEEQLVQPGLTGRARWLKVNTQVTKRERKTKTQTKTQTTVQKEDKKETATKQVAFVIADDITEAELNQKVIETVSMRGRRGADLREMIRHLTLLGEAGRRFGPMCEIPILSNLVSVIFDIPRTMDDCLSLADWKRAHNNILKLMNILDAHPGIKLGTAGADDIADIVLAQQGAIKAAKARVEGEGDDEDEDEDEEKEDDAEAAPVVSGVVKIMGSLYNFVSRLDEEYTKALQKIEPHTTEYVERLRVETHLVNLARRCLGYFKRSGDMPSAAQVALLCVEHMYYKHESIAAAVTKAQRFAQKYGKFADMHPAAVSSNCEENAAFDSSKTHPASAAGTPVVDDSVEDIGAVIDDLCKGIIFQFGDARAKARAMLCSIAHHALHDRFFQARDLLLMSHLQETITQADIHTQILFNRTLVMMGLCAFRAGKIWDAHQCLSEICSSRVKELLAQGIQSNRFGDKNPEQEKAERRRQTPYHMHINLELIEASHLISAMLLEVPKMATENVTDRPKRISHTFRKFMNNLDRQVFAGPPENTRDHVLVAAKCLAKGDWEQCTDLILNGIEIWNLIPGEGAADKVKTMLAHKIKCEALRTYLFSYSSHYDSLSLPKLCAMFGLDKKTSHGVISKMIINQELHASWDQTTETVILHRVDPSHLQALALQYADKVAQLVDMNEKFLEARSGTYNKDEWSGRGDKWQGGRDKWQGGRDNRQGGRDNRQGGRDNRQGGRDNRQGGRDNRGGRWNDNRQRGGGGKWHGHDNRGGGNRGNRWNDRSRYNNNNNRRSNY